MRKLPAGLGQAHRAMELANEDVTMKMEHRTTYLATVGTLGPMIGLVGTVYGMILAFRVIAQVGAPRPRPASSPQGISTALFATLEGIAVSIPAIYFYALFRNRIARLSLEVGMTAEPLLERFVPGVRTTGPGPGAGAGGAAGTVASPAAACPSLRRQRRDGGAPRPRRRPARTPPPGRRLPSSDWQRPSNPTDETAPSSRMKVPHAAPSAHVRRPASTRI